LQGNNFGLNFALPSIVLAALAISAMGAAPAVAFAEATHPAKTTISAEPNDNDFYYNVGDPAPAVAAASAEPILADGQADTA
jgi:hypothetical protein